MIMDIGLIDEKVKTRKSSSKKGRFVLAGILLFLSLFVASQTEKDSKSAK